MLSLLKKNSAFLWKIKTFLSDPKLLNGSVYIQDWDVDQYRTTWSESFLSGVKNSLKLPLHRTRDIQWKTMQAKFFKVSSKLLRASLPAGCRSKSIFHLHHNHRWRLNKTSLIVFEQKPKALLLEPVMYSYRLSSHAALSPGSLFNFPSTVTNCRPFWITSA